MSSGTTVAACLWVGLLMRLAVGHSVPTTAAPATLEQILEKLARMEQEHSSCDNALESIYSLVGVGSSHLESLAMENKILALEAKLEALETKQEATNTALQSTRVQSKGASTFIRWGRSTCSNSSELAYSGVVGGSHYSHKGAAANHLCLTLSPETDSTALPVAYTYLYGAEYQDIPNHHDHNVPCAVCRATQPTTIMIPATHACPQGWTTQYTGHLAAGHHTHEAATEFVCLDRDPEHILGGHENHDGDLFYYVVAQCGSLPCPTYINGKIVLCVVCSK